MLERQHIPHLLEFTITTQYLGKEAKGKNFLVIISLSLLDICFVPHEVA